MNDIRVHSDRPIYDGGTTATGRETSEASEEDQVHPSELIGSKRSSMAPQGRHVHHDALCWVLDLIHQRRTASVDDIGRGRGAGQSLNRHGLPEALEPVKDGEHGTTEVQH